MVGRGRRRGGRDGSGSRGVWTTPALKPPRTARNKIPLNEVVCIICGETGHWAKDCVKVHPKFKEAQAKREAASVTNACKLVDDLRHQVQHYKALSDANSAANSDVGSEEDSEGGRMTILLRQ